MEMYQKGDRVWTVEEGFGTVSSVSTDLGVRYPVEVSFDSGRLDSFTKCGRRLESGLNPSLFFEPIGIPEIKRPLPKLAVGAKVRVRDNDGAVWKKRYFSHFDDEGGIYCFLDGGTEWSMGHDIKTHWKFYEVVE